MPQAIAVLTARQCFHVVLKFGQHSRIGAVLAGHLRQRERQPQSGKSIAAAPGGFGQRRVAVKAIAALSQTRHEQEMPLRHIEVATLFQQLAGPRQNGRSHKYRI